MRVCDLHNKQVINTCDCKILGCVIDIDFDECSGCIKALIVPGPGRLCGLFGRDNSIPMCQRHRSRCCSC